MHSMSDFFQDHNKTMTVIGLMAGALRSMLYLLSRRRWRVAECLRPLNLRFIRPLAKNAITERGSRPDCRFAALYMLVQPIA